MVLKYIFIAKRNILAFDGDHINYMKLLEAFKKALILIACIHSYMQLHKLRESFDLDTLELVRYRQIGNVLTANNRNSSRMKRLVTVAII